MNTRKTTVSALALLLASAGAAAAFPATATSDVNVRSGPGTGYSVVDRLEAGDTVEVVGSQGSWYQVAEGGWANASYLEEAGGGGGYTRISTYPDYYGSPAFYYGSDPYFYDDAGYYFYWREGRRHNVGWNWFRDHDHNKFRWSDNNHRSRFEANWKNNDGGFKGQGKWKGPQQNNQQVNSDLNRNGEMRRGDGVQGQGWKQGQGPNKGQYWQGQGQRRIQGGGNVEMGRASVEGNFQGGGGQGYGSGGQGKGGPGFGGGGQGKGGQDGGAMGGGKPWLPQQDR